MKNTLSLILLILSVLFYCQDLDIKILDTKISSKKDIIIKIEIINKSEKNFYYNKKIEINNSKSSDFSNLITFYDNDKIQNILNIHYKKYLDNKPKIIHIKPYSQKKININLKKDLPKARYNGLRLTLNTIDYTILKYRLLLFFKDGKNDSYEKYNLSSEINMEKVSN
ncbi:hypothetical protein GCM10023210_03830 [Chryseobacterium ginsengisoli]|uniref:Uncharacterized protein n=1 Tax=Chryseobacterium ginsengisoli TaxID=363853 RepID=A0ABP9LRW2_9FLAO